MPRLLPMGCPHLVFACDTLFFEEPSFWGTGRVPAGLLGSERWGLGEQGQEKAC